MDYKWKDYYFERAKLEGFKSRAAYKLIEIDHKYKILRRGRRVLDLGSAPGGWLQIAVNSVGNEGFVYGVDKIKFHLPGKDNLMVIEADILQDEGREYLFSKIEKKVDAILSDMAPKFTGIRDTDNAMLLELYELAYLICTKILKKGGDLLIKGFHSNELNEFRTRLENNFNKVISIVPEATRRASSENYLFGKGFKAKEL
jgi:23S rRNA (uridine2552-2'-O)-methyltransferase